MIKDFNYCKHDIWNKNSNLYWNTLPLEVQLNILNKYFKIGYDVKFNFDIFKIINYKLVNFSYEEDPIFKDDVFKDVFYILKIQKQNLKSDIETAQNSFEIHPAFIIPTEKYIRESKIENILNA